MNGRAVKIIALVIILLTVALLGLWYWYVPSDEEPPYNMVMSRGLKGSKPGHFDDPIGIAVSKNEVYVADSKNNRIQVFDHNGYFKRQFGTRGSQPGQLKPPMHISYLKGKLYVAEYYNHRVQVFDASGKSLHILNLNQHIKDAWPTAAQVSQLGHIYVPILNHHVVLKLSVDGEKLGQIGHNGHKGNQSDHIHYPIDVSLNDANNKYVLAGLSNRIQVYDKNNNYLKQKSGEFNKGFLGEVESWLKMPSAIAIGSQGNIFIADSENNRIQKFSPQGEFLTAFGSKGRGKNKLSYPIGVDVDQNGDVYVVDYGNQRITKWRPQLKTMNKNQAM